MANQMSKTVQYCRTLTMIACVLGPVVQASGGARITPIVVTGQELEGAGTVDRIVSSTLGPDGTVVFKVQGSLADGLGSDVMYSWRDGALHLLSTREGFFSPQSAVALNKAGEILFWDFDEGNPSRNPDALFVWNGFARRRVLGTHDFIGRDNWAIAADSANFDTGPFLSSLLKNSLTGMV